MSEAKRLSGAKQPGRPADTDADKNSFYGDIWLLEQVADKTGLRSDLKQVFDNNEEVINSILTLAYFSVLTGYSYNRVARWQRIERTPYSKELTPSAITYLTQSISEKERMALFRLRAARLKDDAVCAVDSASEVVVYSLDDHMPVYYRTFLGNIPYSRSVETLLTDLRHAGFSNLALLTDMTAMQTWELYGLWDKQEKYFQHLKSQLCFDRKRNWSEEGKTAR